ALKLAELKPDMVFLAGRWAMYTETTRAVGEKGSRVYLGDETDYSESIDNSRRAIKEGLERTIRHLVEAGIKPILFEQAPSYSSNP
uniref:SGNH hydrolase domain-containing protein n=1 Tax=Vibrio cholerae TaxID=666 RepID=UPI001A1FFCD4